MNSSIVRAPGKGSDAYRGYSRLDTLHLSLFDITFTSITPHSWQAKNVCSSYWRFYRNDADGAELLLYGESGEKHPFALEAGESFLIPAGVRFDCLCEAPSVGHFYIHFEVSGLPGLFFRDHFNRPLCVPRSSGASEKSSGIAAEINTGEGKRTGDLALFCRAKSLLYDSLAASLRVADHERYASHADLLEPVLPALEMIEKRLGESLANKLLAEACCISEDYFIRRFREGVGETPAHYIQSRRLETAANRLLFSADSIERIADECGFGNRFHFTRVFTARFAVAPAAYRKAGRV